MALESFVPPPYERAGALLCSKPDAALLGPRPDTGAVRRRHDVSSCLVVRARPQSSAPSIACLNPGTQVEAVGTAPYWRQIRLTTGTTGWAAKKFLAIVAAPPVAPATDDRDDAWLEVHVVDVGQGDGIWIHTFDDNIPGNGRYEGYNIIRYCDRSDATRIYRTDQDDEAERRTATTDADGDHIVISMNGKETRIQAYSAGNSITPTACVP